jgi:hypothetical protein
MVLHCGEKFDDYDSERCSKGGVDVIMIRVNGVAVMSSRYFLIETIFIRQIPLT